MDYFCQDSRLLLDDSRLTVSTVNHLNPKLNVRSVKPS